MDIAILSNVPVKLGQAKPLKSKLDSLSMEGGFQTVEIPILIVTSNPYLQNLINLFLLDKASNNYKDLSSVAKAMKTWVRWLIENRVDPFAIAKTKSKSPTYGFRQYLLERVHEKNNLKSSTANKYMLTIEAFYKMLAQEGIVQQKHFYRSKLSIIDGYRKLQSSDLAIRVSRALEGNLRPLDHETQRKALQVVEQENEEFKLAFKLMMFSGLRLNESLSFPSFLLLDECFPIDGSKLIRGVNIGPMYGVKTKFSKERELFITVRLAEEIVNYQLSDRYQKKFLKYSRHSSNSTSHIPLFISNRSKALSKAAFYSAWARFKLAYKKQHQQTFKHKPHDLRATFATNMLEVALNSSPKDFDSCIETARYYMGHLNIETTLKYVRFTLRRSTAKKVADVMDKYVYDVFLEV